MKADKLKVKALIAVTLLIIMLPYSAAAKVKAYVTAGQDNNLYEFDYADLVRAYVFSAHTPQPLYQEFAKGETKYLLDDVNGYVDYHETVRAFVFASGNFDLDAYTSGPKAKIVQVDKVNVVTVENGKLVFTEKILADPEAAALQEVNSASDAASLRSVLESRANVLGLDLSSYNKLLAGGKTAVASGVLARRAGGFADVAQLKSAFAEEVQAALADVNHILETVNGAGSGDEFEQLLLEHGEALGLEMQAYTAIISSRKEQAISALYASVPYASKDLLQTAYHDAVAAVLNSYVIVAFTEYDLSAPGMVDIQMPLKPQWYVSGVGWRDAPREQVEYYVDPANFVPADLADYVTEVIVAVDVLNVRDNPSTSGSIVARVKKGEIYTVEEVREVAEGTAPGTEGTWFRISVGAAAGWVFGAYTDWVAETYSPQMLQFLTLSGSSGVTLGDLAIILDGKGILSGEEEVFFQASRDNNINEIFLTSMALHESGNGTSQLANGVLFTPTDPSLEPRIVYNMYGIGAIDANPIYKGAEYAYSQGWFTPEAAISGGAYFVSRNYVNNTTYHQNTLYKIRWNPGNPGKHQYASDIAWASTQTSFIRKLYAQLSIYTLKFDIPRYQK